MHGGHPGGVWWRTGRGRGRGRGRGVVNSGVVDSIGQRNEPRYSSARTCWTTGCASRISAVTLRLWEMDWSSTRDISCGERAPKGGFSPAPGGKAEKPRDENPLVHIYRRISTIYEYLSALRWESTDTDASRWDDVRPNEATSEPRNAHRTTFWWRRGDMEFIPGIGINVFFCFVTYIIILTKPTFEVYFPPSSTLHPSPSDWATTPPALFFLMGSAPHQKRYEEDTYHQISIDFIILAHPLGCRPDKPKDNNRNSIQPNLTSSTPPCTPLHDDDDVLLPPPLSRALLLPFPRILRPQDHHYVPSRRPRPSQLPHAPQHVIVVVLLLAPSSSPERRRAALRRRYDRAPALACTTIIN